MRHADEIFEEAQALTADDHNDLPEVVGRLFEEAEGLEDTNHLKLPLLQSLAHSLLMHVVSHPADWRTIDEAFQRHCRVGFSRIDSQLAAFVVYAECAVESGDAADAATAIQDLERLIVAAGSRLENKVFLSRRAHVAELKVLLARRLAKGDKKELEGGE